MKKGVFVARRTFLFQMVSDVLTPADLRVAVFDYAKWHFALQPKIDILRKWYLDLGNPTSEVQMQPAEGGGLGQGTSGIQPLNLLGFCKSSNNMFPALNGKRLGEGGTQALAACIIL